MSTILNNELSKLKDMSSSLPDNNFAALAAFCVDFVFKL
jgi:hypothetical protein